jgi:CubicO group peptidase (beta-lactamase class C family)
VKGRAPDKQRRKRPAMGWLTPTRPRPNGPSLQKRSIQQRSGVRTVAQPSSWAFVNRRSCREYGSVRVVVALVLLLAGCGGQQSPPLAKASDAIVAGGVPGALAVVRDGDRVRSAVAGLADVDANSRLQAADRFRIGSVTKTFVATAVLQLVAENQLRLDEPVARLLPRLLPDGERITIRDLLAHRSGLADVADDPAVLEGRRSNWSPQKLVRRASQQPRISAPGSAFHYSSTNYLVLGLVVERVTHQTLSAVLAHRIIAPLGLSNTSFEPAVITGPHVHGYSSLPTRGSSTLVLYHVIWRSEAFVGPVQQAFSSPPPPTSRTSSPHFNAATY